MTAAASPARLLSGALRQLALLAVLASSCLAASAPARAQALVADTVAERGETFGRLTLTFRDRLDLPEYEIETENGVLRLTFDEPVDTDIRDAVRVLSDFVTIARRDPDGLALRFGLSRSVRINTMEAGEVLFVDFLPPNWQGFPPPLPEEVVARLSSRAEEAARRAAIEERRRLLGELQPEVTLRVGAAPTFTRYSFGWNIPFDVEASQSGSTLTLVFGYDVPLDLSPALIDRAEDLEDITVASDGLELTVTMTFVPGSRVRWFQDELAFVVDLDRNTVADPADPDARAVAAALDALGPPPGDGQAVAFEALGARDESAVVADAPSPGETAMVRQGPVQLLLAPGAEAGAPQDAAVAEEQVPEEAAAVPRPPEVRAVSEVIEEDGVIRAEVRHDGDTYRLVFPFRDSTAAAVMRRANIVTLVFETQTPIDMRTLGNELSDVVEAVSPIRQTSNTLVHLTLGRDLIVTAEPSGTQWIVSLGRTVLDAPGPLPLGRGTLPDGRAYASFAAEGFAEPVRFTHPQGRDQVVAVPMHGPTRGVLTGQSLVEFDVMGTAHGLALLPKVDDLVVTRDREGVQITREVGLNLSDVGLPLGSLGFAPSERAGYFDFRRYLGEGPGSFEDRFADFNSQLAAVEEPSAQVERLLEFARFLLAFELGQEAIGALDVAMGLDPALEHDGAYLLMRAAAQTIAGRFEEAAQILDLHAMADVQDAALWRVLSAAGLRDWEGVNAAYDDAAALFDDYPASLVTQARLAGVSAALETRAIDTAHERLVQIDPMRAGPAQAAALQLLDARLAQARGALEEAIAGYEMIRKADPGPIGAQATLLHVKAQLDAGKIGPDEAMEALENLAVAWRGDNTEVATRMRLSELYIAADRYRDALFALKGVLIAQPDHPDSAAVADQMQEIFVELFLNGHADGMPPIDALSLFYDFRELTPIGRRGDELVRRLVDRLVELDLLDQAADLLEHQVENRLTGTAKAQVAADLALIYLMDYRPGEAVSTLQRSRLSQVPMSIERVRRIIEARALSELGRHELALEVLRSVDGDDAAAVRADVLWNAERWQEAGEELERMLGERWSDRVPLDDGEMQQVLRAAIAFSFAGDDYALDRLRGRFDAKMSDGVFASAFDVVTAPIDARGSAFRDVARAVAGVNTLSRFLEDYRSTFSRHATAPLTPGA